MEQIFSWPVTVILLLILGACSFIFSASETSIIGLSRIKLRHMLSKGMKRAHHIQRLVSNLDKFIIAILVGNNFINIAISAIITAILISIFGYKWGAAIATVLTAFILLIFCEITPKILAIKFTERTALFIAPIMEVFIRVFNPLIFIFRGISNLVIKLLRITPAKRSPLVTKEELRMMIEIGKEEGFFSDEEGKMLHRIFEFGGIRVGDIMIPKEKIVAVNINSASEQVLDIFVEQGHARLPVYQDSIENIIGVIYAHDLLYTLRDKGLFVLQDIIHQVAYIPGSKPVNEVLKKFQTEKIQIAIVVDQHKKTVGLVTLEDLTEEIVGEIEEGYFKQRRKKSAAA